MDYEDRYMEALMSKCECCLLDLDDTLYHVSTGLASECNKNIQKYMAEKLRIDESKVPNLCSLLYKNYGTTMVGLRAIGYNLDYDDYHSLVHGKLPYDNLKPDLVLRQILLSLPIRKVIFTNADRKHAIEVLKRLELEDCFEEIICFETLNPIESTFCEPENAAGIFDIVNHFTCPDAEVELPKTPIKCKPQIDAMKHALRLANINPHTTVFFDDSVRNIESGKHIGLRTVLVGHSQKVKGADYALESIHNIKEALYKLWEESQKPEDVWYTGNVALETPVTA